MCGVDVSRWGRVALLVALGSATGCATTVVYSRPWPENPAPGVIRVAQERGITDLSPAATHNGYRPRRKEDTAAAAFGPVHLRIPVEVRAGDRDVRLPGCAIRVFRPKDVTRRELNLDLLRGETDDTLRLVDPADSVISMHSRRTVTLEVTGPAVDTANVLALAIDQRKGSLATRGTANCEPIEPGSDSIQVFGFQRVHVQESGPALVAGVGGLILLILMGR